MRLVTTLGLVALAIASVRAQVERGPAFEVASVKKNNSGDVTHSELKLPPGGRFTATNVPLKELILLAYGLRDLQLVGSPGWITSERFDIEARADAELTPGVPPPQLRALLAERFNLQIHRETRELPVYRLVLARADKQLGPRLHPAPIDYCAQAAARSRAPRTADAAQAEPLPCLFRMYGGMLAARSMGLAIFASRLASEVNRFVVDNTGLEGLYDYDLTWSPEQGPAAGNLDGPSLFTALQEQLGLKLESGRAPIEVTVVDRVDHLIPN